MAQSSLHLACKAEGNVLLPGETMLKIGKVQHATCGETSHSLPTHPLRVLESAMPRSGYDQVYRNIPQNSNSLWLVLSVLALSAPILALIR